MLAGTLPAQASTGDPAGQSTTAPPSAALAAKKPNKPAKQNPFVTATPSKTLILTPRPGARLRTTTVKVAVPLKFSVERAKVNGTRIGGNEFQSRANRRVLEVTSAHGLKYRKNTVTVVARNRVTHHLKRQTVAFTLPHRKRLTSAGRDRVIEAGQKLRLKGMVKVHPSLRKAVASGGPKLAWKVVRAPGQAPSVNRTAAIRANVQTQRPGRYTFKATSGGSADTVSIVASLPPMVELNTGEKKDGVPGVRIGTRYYANPAPASAQGWQVLVLDSATGAMRSNRAYECFTEADTGCDVYAAQGKTRGSLLADLAALVPDKDKLAQSDALVIAVAHNPQVNWWDEVFASIGQAPDFTPGPGGPPMAVIGVPGSLLGDAASNPNGHLKGVLVKDGDGKFAFVHTDRTTFDTRFGDDCDTRTPCSITMWIGEGAKTNAALPPGGGAVVASFDEDTLAPIAQESFDLRGTPLIVNTAIARMLQFINKIPKDALVVVNTSGPPGEPRMDPFGFDFDLPEEQRDRSRVLADAIENLGGTGHAFLQSTRKGGEGYSLIGWKGAGAGEGEETRGFKARMEGALTRDTLSRYRPVNVSDDGLSDSEWVDRILYSAQDPTGFPGSGDTAYQAALAYLETEVIPDPGSRSTSIRASYWTDYPRLVGSAGGLDSSKWLIYANAVKEYKGKAPAGAPFDDAKLDEVRKQLATELYYVGYVRSYLEQLQAPLLSKVQDDSFYNALKEMPDKVKAAADQAREQTPTADVDWETIVATIIHMIGAVLVIFGGEEAAPIIEGFTTAIAGWFEIGGVADEAIKGKNEAGEQQEKRYEDRVYTVTVDNLVTEILDGLKDSMKSMTLIGDIVVSDWAKLKEFGSYITCDDPIAGCQTGTVLSKVNGLFKGTQDAIQRTGYAHIYREIVPLAYDVVRIPPLGRDGVSGEPEGNWDPARFGCFRNYPFTDDKLPQSVQGSKLVKRAFKPFIYAGRESVSFRDQVKNAPTFRSYVIGIGTDSGWRFPEVDKKLGSGLEDVLRVMFSPVAVNGVPTAGGLGIDPAEFIEDIPGDDIKQWSGCGGWAGDNDAVAPLD